MYYSVLLGFILPTLAFLCVLGGFNLIQLFFIKENPVTPLLGEEESDADKI